ncbi:hypothetical protein [Roseibium algicola]|uniref:hypothetical protein n=1 Tax=Roseibium algicola TaxID=2857014 RepID=UPI000986140E
MSVETGRDLALKGARQTGRNSGLRSRYSADPDTPSYPKLSRCGLSLLDAAWGTPLGKL